MAKRRRRRKRGTGPTILILLVTSTLVGIALWALWRVTLQSEPAGVSPTPAAQPQEDIGSSERKRLEEVLRQTGEQRRGDATKQ